MSGDHARREIVTGDKPTGSGKTPSRESGVGAKAKTVPFAPAFVCLAAPTEAE